MQVCRLISRDTKGKSKSIILSLLSKRVGERPKDVAEQGGGMGHRGMDRGCGQQDLKSYASNPLLHSHYNHYRTRRHLACRLDHSPCNQQGRILLPLLPPLGDDRGY